MMDSSTYTWNVTDAAVYRVVAGGSGGNDICKLSTRQIAELVGRTRKTVAASLGRLAKAGAIVKVRASSAGRPTWWTARMDSFHEAARITPRDVAPADVDDLFRRRDLHGPGALYVDLPSGREFTSSAALRFTTATRRVRTVDWWLLTLASQWWPLVDEYIPNGSGPSVWRKNVLSPGQLQENRDHIDSIASVRGTAELMTKTKIRHLHQRERFVSTMRSAVAPSAF